METNKPLNNSDSLSEKETCSSFNNVNGAACECNEKQIASSAQSQNPVISQPKQKKNRKKALIALISIAVIIVFLLLIFIIASFVKDKNTDNTPYTPPIEDETIELIQGEDPFVEGEIKSTPISLSDESLTEFESYLSTVKPAYEYSDLYAIDENLELYKNNVSPVKKHAHNVRKDGKLDSTKLYNLVLNNNKAFLEDEDTLSNMYKTPSNDDIKLYCDAICKVLTLYEKNYPEIDMDRVCCNLYDLKILYPISNLSLASVDADNIFYFSEEQIENAKLLLDTEDPFKTTFYHEMVHLCQISCDCYNTDNLFWRQGINADFDVTDQPDALCWYWFTEASAEMTMANTIDESYTTYKSYIGYANSVAYVTLLQDDVEYRDILTLSFSNDINDLYKIFDVQTEEEKLEIIKMMYSIEILQTQPAEFDYAYEKKYGKPLNRDDEAEDRNFAIDIKDDALLSLTKIFYRNLARQVNNGDVTLEDALYLIRIWEAKLGYHTACEVYGYVARFEDFYSDYLEIQEKFFTLLGKDNELSADELNVLLENYSINIQQGAVKKSPNCDLKFFTEAEKNAVKDFITYYYATGYPNIKGCLEWSNEAQTAIDAHYNKTPEAQTATSSTQEASSTDEVSISIDGEQ